MTVIATLRSRVYGRLFAAALALALGSGSTLALTVSMPTSVGNRNFDSAAFVSAIQSGPSGEYACFAGGTLTGCTSASLQLAVIGPDLTTGLTLGFDAEVVLTVPATGSVLAVWEAGDFSDAEGSLVSVHTSSGWSSEQSYGTGRIAPVLDDTRPSGYATNYGTFSAADFGLAAGTVFDAVRIRSSDAANAHPDILAVAVAPAVGIAVTSVPEPGAAVLLLAGLLAAGAIARRRLS